MAASRGSLLARLLLLPACLCRGAAAQDIFLAAEGPAWDPIFRVAHDGRFGERYTGRVRISIATTKTDAPSELVFGKDVHEWRAHEVLTLGPGDEDVYGFPVAGLEGLRKQLTADQVVYVRAELVVYDLYKRKGMPPTWLPTSCVSREGKNGQYGKPDGTLLSGVSEVRLSELPRTLLLDQQVPDSTPRSPGCAGLGDAVDSEWVKTVRINSTLLEDFWGRPVSIEACVLVPWGFHQHPDARYPLVVGHGHFSPQFMPGGTFVDARPSCDPLADYDCYTQHGGYELYQDWTAANGTFHGARVLVMTVNHPVPFFDDSYAVNTANMGPYGDAIVKELIPEVERRFRGIGEGWARALLGGSTGGWEAIAQQVFYPDDFNGALAACPDPVAFTSYVTANIYESRNFYFYDEALPWLRRQRPATRDHYSGVSFEAGKGPSFVAAYGRVTQTQEEANHQELALGGHGRSCGQYDIWEATFGPACGDGYPCRLYDKLTGEINRTVAAYWRENFDLAHIIRRDWEVLGPKLKGKLRIAVGASDTFYLTNAVMDLQRVLEELGSDVEVTIGAHDGVGYQHCFNGYMRDGEGRPLPNAVSRLHYLQMNVPRFAQQWVRAAPAGADVRSWRY